MVGLSKQIRVKVVGHQQMKLPGQPRRSGNRLLYLECGHTGRARLGDSVPKEVRCRACEAKNG